MGDFIAKYELLSGLGVVVITAAVGLVVRHVWRRPRATPPAAPDPAPAAVSATLAARILAPCSGVNASACWRVLTGRKTYSVESATSHTDPSAGRRLRMTVTSKNRAGRAVVFQGQWTYLQNVTWVENALVFSFSPASATFQVKIRLTDVKTGNVCVDRERPWAFGYQASGFKVQVPAGVTTVEARIILDDCLVYNAVLVREELLKR